MTKNGILQEFSIEIHMQLSLRDFFKNHNWLNLIDFCSSLKKRYFLVNI